jgi:hypothetical protein
MWFWWWGQLEISDAGPANAIKIHLKSYELDAKIHEKVFEIKPAPRRCPKKQPGKQKDPFLGAILEPVWHPTRKNTCGNAQTNQQQKRHGLLKLKGSQTDVETGHKINDFLKLSWLGGYAETVV